MQSIRDLLNQIRWDRNFTGDFEIAFLDRTKPELERLAVRDMRETDSPFTFGFVNDAGGLVAIPLHRIRQVYRNGTLIWSRPVPPTGGSKSA
jgi:uncharacterized protein (UPF0248 family)